MIIDFQHHYLPEVLWRKRGGKPGERTIFYRDGRPRLTLNEDLYRIDRHLQDMDVAGIDVAVLSMAGKSSDRAEALEESKIYNDKCSQLMKEYPKRIVGLAPIPPLAGEQTFAEMDRAVNVLGLRGVHIESQVEGLPLDSKELWPFYEKVSGMGIPIFVHVAGVPEGYEALSAHYDLYRSIGREFDLVAATTRIVCGGVLEEFPDLKFVIGHMGGGISAIIERIEHYLGARETSPNKPFRHYFDKIYFDMAGFVGGMTAVKCALNAISPERLVFATDYPQNFTGDALRMKDYVANIGKLGLGKQSEGQMLGANAAELLGLNA